MPTANEALFDASVRHQVNLQRLSKGEANKVLRMLEESDKELRKLIAERAGGLSADDFTTARWKAMRTEIARTRTSVIQSIGDNVGDVIEDLAVLEQDIAKAALQRAVPVEINFATTSPTALRAMAQNKPFGGADAMRTLTEWMVNLEEADQNRIRGALQAGVAQGETIPQITNRVQQAMDLTKKNAEAITRTGVNHISNAAREEFFKENDDVIQALRWTSTLDGRTSAICRARDGHYTAVEGSEGENVPSPKIQGSPTRPPAHLNCRSLMVAVLDSDAVADQMPERPFVKDARTRRQREIDFRKQAKAKAGDDWKDMSRGERNDSIRDIRRKWSKENVGTVPGDTTYDEWLRRQDAEFQDDVLGPTKGKLFREGRTMDQFVDRQGNELTIDELEQKTPPASQQSAQEREVRKARDVDAKAQRAETNAKKARQREADAKKRAEVEEKRAKDLREEQATQKKEARTEAKRRKDERAAAKKQQAEKKAAKAKAKKEAVEKKRVAAEKRKQAAAKKKEALRKKKELAEAKRMKTARKAAEKKAKAEAKKRADAAKEKAATEAAKKKAAEEKLALERKAKQESVAAKKKRAAAEVKKDFPDLDEAPVSKEKLPDEQTFDAQMQQSKRDWAAKRERRKTSWRKKAEVDTLNPKPVTAEMRKKAIKDPQGFGSTLTPRQQNEIYGYERAVLFRRLDPRMRDLILAPDGKGLRDIDDLLDDWPRDMPQKGMKWTPAQQDKWSHAATLKEQEALDLWATNQDSIQELQAMTPAQRAKLPRTRYKNGDVTMEIKITYNNGATALKDVPEDLLETWEEALRKAPTYDGEVWRGIGVTRGQLDDMIDSGTIKLLDDQSASVLSKKAWDFGRTYGINEGKETVMFRVLKQNNGKMIMDHALPGEAEVVLRMGSQYRIVNVVESTPGITVLELEEI